MSRSIFSLSRACAVWIAIRLRLTRREEGIGGMVDERSEQADAGDGAEQEREERERIRTRE